MRVRSGIAAAIVSFVFSIVAHSQSSDLQQYLTGRYQNKILLVRGFYSNDELRFDAGGAPVGNASPGFWTVDGFVLVTDVEASVQKLRIKGKRMIVTADGKGFHFFADSPKKRKRGRSVNIEASLANGSREDVGMLTAKIFLGDGDSLLAQVPWFWQTCVSAGLNQVNDSKFASCQFTQEMLSVPGMNARADLRSKSASGETEPPVQKAAIFKVGTGVSPPKMVYSPEPQFSDASREIGFQGVATLGLIVDAQGMPRNLRILSPLGAGLDEQAVAAIASWKFKPAEQKGSGPVAVEIAVEVDFHR
jgi:TonB family protein